MGWKTDNARLIISAAHSSQFPETHQKEVVMVGKSNVGKSSLINALTNRKRLAYVGQTPGKTRLINFYEINDEVILTDVPGYGFANRSKKEQEHYAILMDSYFSLRPAHMMLILVDVRRGISADDEMMIDFAAHHGMPHAIVLTKTDKLSKNKVASIKQKTYRSYPSTSVLTFSSLDNSTREPIIEYLKQHLGV